MKELNKSKVLQYVLLVILFSFIGYFTRIVWKDKVRAHFFMENDFKEISTLKLGDSTEFYVKFINRGLSKLKLTNVNTDCGCTAVNWTSISPVKYNQADSLLVKFKPEGLGTQLRKIIIESNSHTSPDIYYIHSYVIE